MLHIGLENDPERIIQPGENYPTNQQQPLFRKEFQNSVYNQFCPFISLTVCSLQHE